MRRKGHIEIYQWCLSGNCRDRHYHESKKYRRPERIYRLSADNRLRQEKQNGKLYSEAVLHYRIKQGADKGILHMAHNIWQCRRYHGYYWKCSALRRIPMVFSGIPFLFFFLPLFLFVLCSPIFMEKWDFAYFLPSLLRLGRTLVYSFDALLHSAWLYKRAAYGTVWRHLPQAEIFPVLQHLHQPVLAWFFQIYRFCCFRPGPVCQEDFLISSKLNLSEAKQSPKTSWTQRPRNAVSMGFFAVSDGFTLTIKLVFPMRIEYWFSIVFLSKNRGLPTAKARFRHLGVQFRTGEEVKKSGV